MMQLTIDADFVADWSERYRVGEPEKILFHTTGPEARAAGYLTKAQLGAIGEWKSRRPRSWLATNSTADVEIFTRLAFGAPPHVRHRVLCCLSGVRQAMASAILTVVFPDTYTVWDVRATNTLRSAGYADIDDYWSYVTVCQGLATEIGTDLRTLDRALWTWDSTHNGRLRSR